MRVWRVLRVVLPLLLVALLIGGVVAVLTARPDIESAKDKVDASWAPLASVLGQRYEQLASAEQQLQQVPGSVKVVATDVDTALARWRQVKDEGSIDAKVRAANDVEVAGRRLLVTAALSQRVDQATRSALGGYQDVDPRAAANAFNASVAEYQSERRGPVRALVASWLGGGNIPGYDVPPTE
jgi:hypothetical protein